MYLYNFCIFLCIILTCIAKKTGLTTQLKRGTATVWNTLTSSEPVREGKNWVGSDEPFLKFAPPLHIDLFTASVAPSSLCSCKHDASTFSLTYLAWCIPGILMTVMVCGLAYATIFQLDAHYYVAIDSVSPDHDPTRGLSFNLTLGVAYRSYGAKACIKPGTYVEVHYHGVQLAVSEAESGELCVEPGRSAGKCVVATVTGVPVGQVMDSLEADMKQGVAVFDVELHLPDGSYGATSLSRDGKWVSECGGMPVGAATVAWCDAPLQIPR